MSDNSELRIAKSDILDAVISSGVLGSSKNQISLFKFLLENKFDALAAELKTKDIAINVYGRDDSFSAKKDSIVRVEMFRLRGNLETFNQQSEFLKVKLPKSSYKLDVKSLQPAKDVFPANDVHIEKPQRKTVFGVGLAVIAGGFILISAGAFNAEPKAVDCSESIPNLEIGVANEASDLHDYVHHVISGAASQFNHFNIVQNIKSCASSNVPGYKLEYVLLHRSAGFQGSLSVSLQPNAKIIGADNFSGVSMVDSEGTSLGREELYFTIAKITNDFLKPNGLVHRDAVNQPWQDKAIFEDYSCLAKMYESFVSDSDEDYYEGLGCLEASYENGTKSLDNLGGLAASYLEQAQGNRGQNGKDSLMQAEVILGSIGDKWPQSPESTIAKIMYDSVRHDYNEQRLRETLLRAEKAYTSHPNVLMDISRYSGFRLGDWDSSVKLINKSRRLMSDQDNSVYQVDAAYAVLGKGDPTAWTNCLKAYSEHSKVSNLLVNACARKYKKHDWEVRTAENLRKFNLIELDEKKIFIENMGFEPLLSEALLKT